MRDLESRSFRRKLDLLVPAITREFGNDPACHADWNDWLAQADALRCKRNDLMHGRWGIYEARSVVSNIIGLPGSPTQREVTYTLDELQDEITQAARVAALFSELSAKWPT